MYEIVLLALIGTLVSVLTIVVVISFMLIVKITYKLLKIITAISTKREL